MLCQVCSGTQPRNNSSRVGWVGRGQWRQARGLLSLSVPLAFTPYITAGISIAASASGQGRESVAQVGKVALSGIPTRGGNGVYWGVECRERRSDVYCTCQRACPCFVGILEDRARFGSRMYFGVVRSS